MKYMFYIAKQRDHLVLQFYCVKQDFTKKVRTKNVNTTLRCGLIVIFGVFGLFAFHDWLWKNSYREITEFFPYKNEKN